MNKIILCSLWAIIALFFAVTANAQDNTKKTSQQSLIITSKTAITDDDRKIILNSDSTWKYSDSVVDFNNKISEEYSTLQLETGIIFNSGDIKPVARTTFYLLDKSLAAILLESGITTFSSENISRIERLYQLFLVDAKFSSNGGKFKDTFDNVWSYVKPHVIDSVTTDFSGKAIFKKLQTGNYFLMGFSTMNKNYMIWDVETILSSGDNVLILDGNNLSYILEPLKTYR